MLKSKLDYEEQQEHLLHRGYTDAEVREILDEATRLEAAAAGRTDSETLLQSAEEAGISREFVEEAMRRWAARRQQQAFRTDSQERLGKKWGPTGVMVGFMAAFFVALLVVFVYFLSGPKLSPPSAPPSMVKMQQETKLDGSVPVEAPHMMKEMIDTNR